MAAGARFTRVTPHVVINCDVHNSHTHIFFVVFCLVFVLNAPLKLGLCGGIYASPILFFIRQYYLVVCEIWKLW